MAERTFSPVYIFPVSNKENCCPQDSKEGHFANHPKDFLVSHNAPGLRAVQEGKNIRGRQCGGGKGT